MNRSKQLPSIIGLINKILSLHNSIFLVVFFTKQGTTGNWKVVPWKEDSTTDALYGDSETSRRTNIGKCTLMY